jgi:hypothetical protein
VELGSQLSLVVLRHIMKIPGSELQLPYSAMTMVSPGAQPYREDWGSFKLDTETPRPLALQEHLLVLLKHSSLV